MNVAFYITGHGLGHAARSVEIIKSIYRKNPSIKFYLRTSVPLWFIEDSLKESINYDYHNVLIDIGVVQRDALRLDKLGTLESFSQFWASRKDLIFEEVKCLSKKKIDFVISDISPIAFLVAQKMGIPSIAISNFVWSYIYNDYVKKYPQYSYLIDEINAAYGTAAFALRYPFYGDFSCFDTVYDIGLVGRKTLKTRNEILNILPAASCKKIILIAFGGFSVDSNFADKINLGSEYYIVDATTLKHTSSEEFLTVPDIVSVASAVITKPGYGIVSECILAQTPMLYTSRGDFAEYGKLVSGMKKYIPACFIPQKSLFAGNIKPYLDRLFSIMPKKALISNSGADDAANIIFSNLKKLRVI